MKITIVGAGGHGFVVAEVAERLGFTDIRFVDGSFPQRTEIGPWPIVDKPESYLEAYCDEAPVFVGIGNNAIRMKFLNAMGSKAANALICPNACVSKYSSVGRGTLVAPSATINGRCNVGHGVIVNTGASIDHDCSLEDGVHISPGAHLGGGVKVGQQSHIGIGASIREGVSIGSHVIVGAGATVIRDIPNGQTVVGTPARPLVRT